MGRAKSGPCVCCHLNSLSNRPRADGEGCDAHHTLSGGRRIGHASTLGLCPWHHRGIRPDHFATDELASDWLGPSLAHGSKPFHAWYGPDEYLFQVQAELHALTAPVVTVLTP